MAQLIINNSNTPKNMKIRITYTSGNGNITISKIEGCRTDSYTTSDSSNGIMKVTIGVATQNISITYPKFNANNNWSTIYSNNIINDNCSGNTNISIGFSGFTANITNSNFSSTIDAGYKAPILSINSYSTGVDYINLSLSGQIIPEEVEVYRDDNSLLYKGSSLTPTIPNLVPNTQYNLKVRGYANGVWGNYSSIINTKTLDVAKPEQGNKLYNTSKNILIIFTNPSKTPINIVIKDILTQEEIVRLNNITGEALSSLSGTKYTYRINFTEEQMDEILQISKNTPNYFLSLILETTGKYDTYEEYADIELMLNQSNPEIETPTYKDINLVTKGITGNNQKIILNYSEVEITIKRMATKNYATPSYYNIIKDNVLISTINDDGSLTYTVNIGYVTGNNIQVEAVDSRGLVTSVNLDMSLITYTPVSFDITKFSVLRENNVGEEVTLKAEGYYDVINEAENHNIITKISYKYQKEGSSEWSELKNLTNFTYSNGNWSIETTIDGDTTLGFNPEYSYNIICYVYDKLSVGNIQSSINHASSLVWYDKENRRVGIGSKPNYDLDVYGEINAQGRLLIQGEDILNHFMYKDGDKIELTSSEVSLSGHVTSGSTNLFIDFYTPKSMERINEIQIDSINLYFRQVNGGYIPSPSSTGEWQNGMSGLTWTAKKITNNLITIKIVSDTVINVTNNTPFVASINQFVITFKEN